ncbi:MAG: hypothetical protein A2X34_03140 [Elusimicrobia bacterium GWC2_51_8]|nr:MAG: hypothetical protein A2X33_09590 [Elusimicrobia bacterium GWA2_51_34]OGR58886.1 MAG: hypothetical protein A2X34_03140 [Elusimicrobia bacterium GWC2_51_8]OGR85385.1 MAG: hypothetical protein A2021_09055 [Elusimicrobia bacterium GWF2_52_66]HAF95035.1 hypothetical protein [Elusimicrobiota bacterium]HCE97948.1 hypothetical protein [Elusimicrobiota bacterium]
MSERWIRKDREQYLFIGVMIACIIGAIVSSYWHASDRIQVRRNIKIKAGAPKEAMKRLKEVQFSPQTPKAGATQYYKLDSGIKPMVPKLGQEYGN